MSEFDHLEEQKTAQKLVLETKEQPKEEDVTAATYLFSDMQEQEQTAGEIETPVLDYAEMAERIKNQDYDRKGLGIWKRHNSEEMQEVIQSTSQVAALIKQEVDFNNFEKELSDMADAYAEAVKACSRYLLTKKPKTAEGRARYNMVQRLSDRLIVEKNALGFNAETIKKQHGDAHVTWGSIVAESHRQILVNGQNGVALEDTSQLCAGSSQLVVYKENDKKYFFKQKEYVIPLDNKAMLTQLASADQAELKELRLGDAGSFAGVAPEIREQRIQHLTDLR